MEDLPVDAMPVSIQAQLQRSCLAVQLVSAKKPARRAELIRMLSQSHCAYAIHVISEALEDDGPVALAGIEALVGFGEDARATLLSVVSGIREGSRRSALLVLARLGDERACERIVREHGEPIAGPLDATTWLVGCGRPGIVTLVRRSLGLDRPTPRLRRHITAQLAARRDTTELVLIELARSGDARMRERALEVLAEMPSRSARGVFESIFADRARTVGERARAMWGFAKLGCVDRVPELRRIANDRGEGLVRQAARKALRSLEAAARLQGVGAPS